LQRTFEISTDLIRDLTCSEHSVLTPQRYGSSNVSFRPSQQVRPDGLDSATISSEKYTALQLRETTQNSGVNPHQLGKFWGRPSGFQAGQVHRLAISLPKFARRFAVLQAPLSCRALRVCGIAGPHSSSVIVVLQVSMLHRCACFYMLLQSRRTTALERLVAQCVKGTLHRNGYG